MSRKKVQGAALEALRKDYEAEWLGLSDLAKQYGVCVATICRYARVNGWERRHARATSPRVAVKGEALERLRKDYEEKPGTLKSIAAAHGICYHTMAKYAKKHGWQRPDALKQRTGAHRRLIQGEKLERLREEYEQDEKGVRTLAREYGVTHRCIYQYASRNDWTRRKPVKPPVTVACDVGLYEMAEVTIEPVAREATYSEALRQVRKDYGLLVMVAMGVVALMVWPLARGLGWLTR